MPTDLNESGGTAWCSLMQTVLWVAKKWDPVSDEDFAALSPRPLPQDPAVYDRLLLALRSQRVQHRGRLVLVREDVESETMLPPDLRAPPRDPEQYDALRAELVALMTTEIVRTIAEEFSIKPHEWRYASVNWAASYVDGLARPEAVPNQVSATTGWGEQWYRLEDVVVCVEDLKQVFPAEPVETKKGGRPQTIEWDWIYREIIIEADLHGLPEDQGDLIKVIGKRYKQKFGKHVGRSTLQEKISPIYNDPRKKGSGPSR
jgi:hypothetical protein